MQLSLPQRLERRARGETRLVEPNAGGRLRVVLAYPNTYAVGMSNLGLHTIYRLLNAHPDVRCERAFLPDADDLEAKEDGDPQLERALQILKSWQIFSQTFKASKG